MIDELIERVEKGGGADRRLDADICINLRMHPYGSDHWLKDRDFSFRHDANCDGWVEPMDRDGVTPLPGGSWKTEAYTASLDAVLALIEEKLPGKATGILYEAVKETWRRFSLHICIEKPEHGRYLPRAALAAFLRAHKEQHDGL